MAEDESFRFLVMYFCLFQVYHPRRGTVHESQSHCGRRARSSGTITLSTPYLNATATLAYVDKIQGYLQ